MSFVSQVYQGTGLGTLVKDYKHASKIFVDSNFRLAPKMGFLFHIAFDINPQITRMSATDILEAGMLVKSMQLPSYTMENKTMNMYNRPNIVQTKLKYDPITITFHDDSSDIIRDLWYDYMSYHYRDTDYSPTTYLQASKYNERQKQGWGFQPSTSTPGNTGADRLIQRVRMYSLHQKRFTEYVLINPTITSFKHGQHTNASDAGAMEHTMTLGYETVLYNYGTIDSGQDTDFAQLHYDNSPSPLGVPALAGSLLSEVINGGGVLGTIVGAATGTQPKTGDIQLSGGRTPFVNNSSSQGGLGNLLGQVALGVSKGNNPFKNLSVPTVGGMIGTVLGSGGISGMLNGQSGGSNNGGFYLQGTPSDQILGTGATSNGDSIGGVFGGVAGGKLGGALSGLSSLSGLSNLGGSLQAMGAGVLNSALGGVNRTLNDLQGKALAGASSILKDAEKQATSLLGDAGNKIGSALSSAGDSISGAVSSASDAFKLAFKESTPDQTEEGDLFGNPDEWSA